MAQKLYHLLADSLCAKIDQPVPLPERAAAVGIVSHRGEHDNREVLENTLAAFDAAVAAGADGIEFDIRWTQDLHPVVFHDADLYRLFGAGCRVCEMRWKMLRTHYPSIPSLAELLERYGGRVHLMAELKKEAYPRAQRQSDILKEAFSALEPETDFHFLSLAPEMFGHVAFVPKTACLPVSETNVGPLSRLSRKKGYGGLLGHYYLIGNRRIARHHKKGQRVGTGYISSANCLYREINRGVDWIFTEQAEKICRIREKIGEIE